MNMNNSLFKISKIKKIRYILTYNLFYIIDIICKIQDKIITQNTHLIGFYFYGFQFIIRFFIYIHLFLFFSCFFLFVLLFETSCW